VVIPRCSSFDSRTILHRGVAVWWF